MRAIHHWLDGKETAGTSGRTADVYNPATGEVQGKVDLASKAEMDAAIAAAAKAQVAWGATNPQRRARVMMNPILHGSGVNIKTVDMLATGRTVVTTTKGARGLPAEVVAELRTDDTPEGFADLIVAAVRDARAAAGGTDRAALVQRIFGAQAVADALAQVVA